MMEKTAEILNFEEEMARVRGYLRSQVWRNHRDLRLLGYIKNGIYAHKAKGEGGPVAA